MNLEKKKFLRPYIYTLLNSERVTNNRSNFLKIQSKDILKFKFQQFEIYTNIDDFYFNN